MMKMNKLKSVPLFILCMVLIAVTVLFATGCSAEKNQPEGTEANSEITGSVKENPSDPVPVEIGSGNFGFKLEIIASENEKQVYSVKTDCENLGDALVEIGFVDESEKSYVKTLNGITADYDVDKTYWAFYIDDKMASVGISDTEITDGAVYRFEIAE